MGLSSCERQYLTVYFSSHPNRDILYDATDCSIYIGNACTVKCSVVWCGDIVGAVKCSVVWCVDIVGAVKCSVVWCGDIVGAVKCSVVCQIQFSVFK